MESMDDDDHTYVNWEGRVKWGESIASKSLRSGSSERTVSNECTCTDQDDRLKNFSSMFERSPRIVNDC